jgi:hypothetical protein
MAGAQVPQQVFIHIGAPKSGSTYLQSVIWANKARLAERGVLVPGNVRFDHNRIAQTVRSANPGAKALAAWDRILEEIRDWPGDVLLSNEWFCMAGQDRVERAVDAFRPSDVHVIATARDLVRLVPSAWQETLKLGKAYQLAEFLTMLDEPIDRWRWSNLDPSLFLPRWQASLPRGNVHVVTVAPKGAPPDLLWNRFAGILPLDPTEFDTDTSGANESLSAESARLMQLVGPRLRDAIDADNVAWNEPYRWVRELVAHQLLVPQRGSGIAIDDATLKTIQAHSEDSVRRLAAAGYDIVGDLAELTGASVPANAQDPEEVSDAALLELAQVVMAGLLRRARDEAQRADAAAQRITRLQDRIEELQAPSRHRSTGVGRRRRRR